MIIGTVKYIQILHNYGLKVTQPSYDHVLQPNCCEEFIVYTECLLFCHLLQSVEQCWQFDHPTQNSFEHVISVSLHIVHTAGRVYQVTQKFYKSLMTPYPL